MPRKTTTAKMPDMPRNPGHLVLTAPEAGVRSYRSDFLRRKLLQKSFKGTEKGVKTLDKLPETVLNGLEVMWRQNLMCDVTLIAQKKSFPAHKLALATCSDYFYMLFAEENDGGSRDTNKVELPDVNPGIMETILEALYTGKIKIEACSVDEILSASSALGIFPVQEACEDFLLEHIGKDNCLHILETAFKYNLIRLTEKALHASARNFQTMSKKPIFRNFPIEHLVQLLKRDDLETENELELFNRVCLWIEENKDCRLQHAAELMATIRLPLLTPSVLVDSVESVEYLMDIPECQRLVKEALHYHCMPSRQCLLQSPRTIPRATTELSLVVIGGAPRLKTDNVSDEICKYNFKTNEWNHVTRMPEPRHHHGVAVLNGFLFVAGGELSNEHSKAVRTVYRFDPRTFSWMKCADMKNCRQSFQMGVLNGCLYAVGGRLNKDESLSSVERYSPTTNTWEEMAPLSCPRRCVAVACAQGRLYAAGGSGNKVISSRVERFNPVDNRWEVMKPINTPRFFGNLSHVQNNLFLVGGATIDASGNVVCLDDVEKFSIPCNQWTSVATIPVPRSEAGCVAIKDKIYIVGGYNWNKHERLSDCLVLDTQTLSWSNLTGFSQSMTGQVATCLTLFDMKLLTKKI